MLNANSRQNSNSFVTVTMRTLLLFNLTKSKSQNAIYLSLNSICNWGKKTTHVSMIYVRQKHVLYVFVYVYPYVYVLLRTNFNILVMLLFLIIYMYHEKIWIPQTNVILNKLWNISTVFQYPFLKTLLNPFSKILLNTIQILKLNCFEFILYIWRNSKQAHISHTPLLLDNDTNKEWQGKH